MYGIRGITILALFVSLFTGCDSGYESEVNMSIEVAGIVSISDDRPAKVVIGAFGYHSNTCVNRDGKVYANQSGSDIYLTGRMEIFVGGECGASVTEAYGEVTVWELEVGEYKIMSGYDSELQRFRIESDAAYVDIDPIIYDFTVSPIVPDSGELEDTSYHVTVSISSVHIAVSEIGCEPILKTDIERTGDVINIDLWRVVPNTDSGCDIVIDPFPTPRYNTEIELGTFSVGSYKVVINGSDYLFDVPLLND